MQLEELGYLVTDCEKKKEHHSGGKSTKEGRWGLNWKSALVSVPLL